MKFFLVLFLLCSSAHAAQFGKIVVDSAAVRQYPSASSSVIGEAVRDQEIAVSNLPTENFYRVRLPDGTMGWVSGNDVAVSKTPFSQSESPQQSVPQETVSQAMETPPTKSAYRERRSVADVSENSRIIIAGGLASLSYSGFPSTIKADSLNYVMTALAEFQFKMSELWFWAGRLEYYSTSSGQLDFGGGANANISQKILPLQVGVQFSPVTASRFRLGAGIYLGVAALSSTKVTVENTTTSYQVEYNSFDPVGTLALQSNIGLSGRIGIFLEAAYRYQQSGEFKETNLGTTIAPFKANYSGISLRGGLEFRL